MLIENDALLSDNLDIFDWWSNIMGLNMDQIIKLFLPRQLFWAHVYFLAKRQEIKSGTNFFLFQGFLNLVRGSESNARCNPTFELKLSETLTWVLPFQVSNADGDGNPSFKNCLMSRRPCAAAGGATCALACAYAFPPRCLWAVRYGACAVETSTAEDLPIRR